MNIIDCFVNILLPTGFACLAVYFPIFILSIFNHSLVHLSKWFLIIPNLIYLLFIPFYPCIRQIPFFHVCIGGLAIYFAQKICEWLCFRRNEFHTWTFFDIQHELFFYRVYYQSKPINAIETKHRRIFYSGSIDIRQHFKSLIYLQWNIIKYTLILLFLIFFLQEIISHNLHEEYILVQILINPFGGLFVYFFLSMNYEICRFNLCLFFNRPLEFIPNLFNQPYRANSPSDFWNRWHQIFRQTWMELIFKPVFNSLDSSISNSIRLSLATSCVFVFSGLIHEYIAFISLRQITGDQMIFFLLQALSILIEHYLKQRINLSSNSFTFILTWTWIILTSKYFFRPWLIYFSTKKDMISV